MGGGDIMATVMVPREVLIRALAKARIEYTRVAAQQGIDPGALDECWAEFERLAEYIDTTIDTTADPLGDAA